MKHDKPFIHCSRGKDVHGGGAISPAAQPWAATMQLAVSTEHTLEIPACACRFCGAALREVFVDLGMSPLSNAFVEPAHADAAEIFHPLRAFVCGACRLVQLPAAASPAEIFSDYPYFSSMSDSWLAHARRYADAIVDRLALDHRSTVVEIASNDGYLLQHFQARGIPILGVEPAANVARAARDKGIPTEIAFFGVTTARRLRAAGTVPDLIVANNVLAHVPDLNDFVAGLRILLADTGTITAEFPHLLRLMEGRQFDTIYHEHFSYFSLLAIERVFARHGLVLHDAEPLPTHGGSLRIHARHAAAALPPTPGLVAIRRQEDAFGLCGPDAYASFAAAAIDTKCEIQGFFAAARRDRKSVIGYGAPAKGNTLLNYCGIGSDLLPFTVDRSPHKQGRLLPGTRIPVYPPAALLRAQPDFVFILPWNLREEIMDQMDAVRSWGGRFVVPIPRIAILP